MEAVPHSRIGRARTVRRCGRWSRRHPRQRVVHAPWDYLGGYLTASRRARSCATGSDARSSPTTSTRAAKLIAAGTPELADALEPAVSYEQRSTTARCSKLPNEPRAPVAMIVRGTTSARRRCPREGARRLGERSRPCERASDPRDPRRAKRGCPCSARKPAATTFDTGWLVDPLDGTVELPARFRRGRRLDRSDRRRRAGASVSCTRRCSTARSPRRAGGRRVPRRPAAARERAGTRAGDRRDRLPVPAQRAARPLRADVRRRVAAFRGPPPGRRREPRPVLDAPRACSTATSSCASGPWDVAAGGLIVREAGGVVTDWDGDDRAWLRSREHPGRAARRPRSSPRDRAASSRTA